MRKAMTWFAIVCVVPYLTSCESPGDLSITEHLWEGSGTSDHSEPAPHPYVRIYQTPDQKDFLVLYDEIRENDVTIKRRAYLLYASEKQVASGHKPKFVSTARVEHLEPLPLIPNTVPESAATNAAGLCAVLWPDQIHFALLRGPVELGFYHLPNYVNTGERSRRIALTPLAVTGDVVIYGSITVLIVGMAYFALAHAGDSGS